jgi:hypothetical protein
MHSSAPGQDGHWAVAERHDGNIVCVCVGVCVCVCVWSEESKLVFTQGRCWISVVGERGAGDRQHPIHLLLLAIKQ